MQSELEAWRHKNEREGLTKSNYDKHSEISSGHGRIETRTYLLSIKYATHDNSSNNRKSRYYGWHYV